MPKFSTSAASLHLVTLSQAPLSDAKDRCSPGTRPAPISRSYPRLDLAPSGIDRRNVVTNMAWFTTLTGMSAARVGGGGERTNYRCLYAPELITYFVFNLRPEKLVMFYYKGEARLGRIRNSIAETSSQTWRNSIHHPGKDAGSGEGGRGDGTVEYYRYKEAPLPATRVDPPQDKFCRNGRMGVMPAGRGSW